MNRSFLNQVENSYIGTDITGTSIVSPSSAALGNVLDGVLIDGGASYSDIDGISFGKTSWQYRVDQSIGFGGTNQAAVDLAASLFDNSADGTVISGNQQNGIEINAASNNIIDGNVFIGTDKSGTIALGNTDSGVLITNGAQSNSILAGVRSLYVQNVANAVPAQTVSWGGTVLRNVISGNAGNGVTIDGGESIKNVIEGALIGMAANDVNSLGNGGDGVLITDAQDRTSSIAPIATRVISTCASMTHYRLALRSSRITRQRRPT